ncbi:MAG TPA: DUF3781 domain-containing protein [Bacteroidales bacterium]|nr:DUF3781 domain-containing protein [Bacteroidales bacterium]HPT21168.1 DUF3781 domain-containing protein [Bacteroidales bacterium]
MKTNKTEILRRLCYTELVYERINKKLHCQLSKPEIEKLLFDVINETDGACFERVGKNIYVTNFEKNIKVTINAHTFRIITVDRTKRKQN